VLETSGAAPRVLTYGPSQGLSSSLVGALLIDRQNNQLWVGGNGGIDRLDLGAFCSSLLAKEDR
jgi:ligand-binding sensor domain-containing protein